MATLTCQNRNDLWVITTEDRAKHDAQFIMQNPVGGFISGEQAKRFFVQSGLSNDVLGRIWKLADVTADGRMDRKEFSIAMHLIKKSLLGFQLPHVLPSSLMVDPPPMGAATLPMASMISPMSPAPGFFLSNMPMHHMPSTMVTGIPQFGLTNSMPALRPQLLPNMPTSTNTIGAGVRMSSVTRDWSISSAQRGKYSQLFNSNDRLHKGFLTGLEAKAVLSQTGLPQLTLAQIWNLADVDKDGNLSPEEFCIAMYLADLAKSGQSLPLVLPRELTPSSGKRVRHNSGPSASAGSISSSVQSFDQSSRMATGGSGMGSASRGELFTDLMPAMGIDSSKSMTLGPASHATFEDKRKENFERGQAELERRREMLRDLQRKEMEDRLAFERSEQEKLEKHRLEQELRKQREFERQREKQRMVEAEKEEQRRKALEQREAARHEMERQRQMEWQRQRRDQLMTERTREQSQVDRLEQEVGQLKMELSTLDSKKIELHGKIEQVKGNIADFTSSIETMRIARDSTVTKTGQLTSDLERMKRLLASIEEERKVLEKQAFSQTPVQDESFRAVSTAFKQQKGSVEKLQSRLKVTEEEKARLSSGIESHSHQLNQLKNQMNSLVGENQHLKRLLSKKKSEFMKRKSTSNHKTSPTENNERIGERDYSNRLVVNSSEPVDDETLTSNQPSIALNGHRVEPWRDLKTETFAEIENCSWASSFFSKPHAVSNAASNYVSSHPRKYTAVYQFDARNSDELSLLVGDVVLVSADQSEVPSGWLSGRLGDRKGLFPEAYVTLASNENSLDSSNPLDETTSHVVASEDSTRYSNLNDSQTSEYTGDRFHRVVDLETNCAPSPTPGQGQDAPDELYVKALYPWRAKKDYHLTFSKGDVIRVTLQQDVWWSGEVNGKVGWFPKTYVKVIEGKEIALKTKIEDAANNHSINSEGGCNDSYQSAQLDQPSSNTSLVSSAPDSESNTGEWYVALYSYSSPEPGDLPFNAGDVINVIGTEGEWWKGILNGRMGDFPANYVKRWEAAADADSNTMLPVTGVNRPEQDKSPTPRNNYVQKKSNQKGKKPDIASVIAAYDATGPEQLSLHVGQLINVRKKSPSGWWEGELQARGQRKKIGWFPANYVKLLSQNNARSTPEATTPTNPAPNPVTREVNCSTPVNSLTSVSTVEQVVALYNYQAQHEDELSFFKGSIINIVKKSGLDWWTGELNGQTGLLPSNYVQPLSESASEQNTLQQAELQLKSGGVLDMTSDMEKKRQDHINELITTEDTYMKDLTLVLDVFYKPMLVSKILTEEELNVIFINWKEIKMCNMKLHKAMRVRRKMCGEGQAIHLIGDILCENLVHMSPYIRFCSCQLNSAALLQKKYETDSRFKDANKKYCQDPRTLGLPLSSFLLKPMQRITKYPLLIEKIFKHTPVGHPDHQNLQEALNKATELCNQVNEGVREKENSDRLEWVQTHVHCDGLAEKITFNSLTNCLGPRKYVHSGTLCKVKSGKELIGILFNDFLLLAQPQRPIGNITSIFTMDMKANVHLKMYRNPIFLNEVMIQKPTESDSDSTIFHISHVERTYSFKAATTNERDNWVRKIESTSKQYLETERKKKEKAHSAHLMSNRGVGRLLVIVVEGINLAACDANAGKRVTVVGRLLVVIVEGCNLTPGEDGKSDPYCEVSMGVQEHKTKVVQSTLNPKWNASMQFTLKDLHEDVLCITVYDRDLFSPNDFLGRTEVRIHDILKERSATKGPITKRLLLHEVESGEVVVKLDLQLFGTL